MYKEVVPDGIRALRRNWGEEVVHKIFVAIASYNHATMSFHDFLRFCDIYSESLTDKWLSGIKTLWPRVYEAIPANIGPTALENLSLVISLCGVGVD